MHNFDLQKLLGLPLEAARELLNEQNIPYEIISYESPRGALGNDRRVLRSVYNGEKAELIVGGFCTDIIGEQKTDDD